MRSRSTDSSGFSSSPSPVRGRTDVLDDVLGDVLDIPDTIEVEGLSRNVTEAHIREIFGKFGMIRKVTLGRGWCQVQYETETEVEGACKYMNGGQLDGNLLECRPYKPQRRTLQSPRQKRSHSRPLNSPRHSRSYSRSQSPFRRRDNWSNSRRDSRLNSRRDNRLNSRTPPRRDSRLHSRTPPRRDNRPSYSRSPPRRDHLPPHSTSHTHTRSPMRH
jgi:RNA-binding protein with serine-rich domain 1